MKKIAVITGASSGMGREMAFQLADRFEVLEEVWLIARRKERLEELRDQFPAAIRCFALDITDETERKQLEMALAEEKPDVKFLVNAAGFGKIGNVGDLSEGDECGMVRLNCEGLTAVTELVLPYISDNSRILQFASAAAFMPQPGFAVYAATKAYVLSYSRALGEELRRRRIFVTAVCPGPVDTEFFGKALNGKPMDPFKRLFMARTKYVVDRAFSDCLKGKPVSVPGLSMKAFYLLCRICPHSLLMKFLTWK